MKNNIYLINILHALVLTVVFIALMAVKAFSPLSVIPYMSIPFMVLICAAAMALEYIVAEDIKRDRAVSIVLAGLAFMLVPYLSGLVSLPLWKLFVAGAMVFGLTDTVYVSMVKRLRSGGTAKAGVIVNVLMLYIASQCFYGVI